MINEKNKKDLYIKSNPYFFKIIGISSVILIIFILIGSIFFDAPLEEKAEPYNAPNPSKSAWFLLWTQELASYGSYYVYIIIFFFIFYMILPFMVKKTPEHAVWFHSAYRWINIISVIVFLAIITLTIIAYFFRKEYWLLGF